MVTVMKKLMVNMIMMMTSMVSSDDEHLGHTPGPPYSLPDLSRYGIRSTPGPIYKRRLENKRIDSQTKTGMAREELSNAPLHYPNNQAHLFSPNEHARNPQIANDKFYESTVEMPPFFDKMPFSTDSFIESEAITEDCSDIKTEKHKPQHQTNIPNQFSSLEPNSFDRFSLSDAVVPKMEYLHQQHLKKQLKLDLSRYPRTPHAMIHEDEVGSSEV